LAAFTPPVGIRSALGKGPLRAFRYFAPPTLPQGNILMSVAPASCAVINSVGVSAPGMASFPLARATEITESDRPGLTRNSAPTARQRLACSALVTVPAPTTILSP